MDIETWRVVAFLTLSLRETLSAGIVQVVLMRRLQSRVFKEVCFVFNRECFKKCVSCSVASVSGSVFRVQSRVFQEVCFVLNRECFKKCVSC